LSNGVVYTAITGRYEVLRNQPPHDLPYVAFLDEPSSSTCWRIEPACRELADPARNAKIHKILAHRSFPDVDFSLYVDGSILLNAAPRELAASYLRDHDIVVHRHPDRDCLYREAEICAEYGLDSPEVIRAQIERYRGERYPEGNGLCELPVILRRHTERVARFNELWWSEIERGSKRDQISFPYAAAQAGLRVGHFPGSLHAWRADFNRLFYKVNRDFVSIVQQRLAETRGTPPAAQVRPTTGD
jgi:hypothetical protein